MADPRTLSGAALAQALRDSRARTWELVNDLTPAQWRVPRAPGVNPIAWELAHVAWVAEFWVLRGPHRLDATGRTIAARPPRWTGPDARFDSALLAHAARWTITLPTRAELVERLGAQLEACVAAVDGASAATLYFLRLALFHEDMHAEAFTWLRASLGLMAPAGSALRMPLPVPLPLPLTTQVQVRGGRVEIGTPLGATHAAAFAFDNEQPVHTLTLADFEIDATPLSAGAFLRFVEAGGYATPAFWPGAAGAWRAASGLAHPQRWRRDPAGTGGWQTAWFDRWLPLDPAAPLIHVNAFEADAYCRWAGRRLPSAAEWEHAAAQIAWGTSVWEWTTDAFQPYPGFVPGPYREYSAPWFGDHRELRGGSFATSARLHDARYRNFFEPHRADVFAGFRTVAATPAGLAPPCAPPLSLPIDLKPTP